MNSRAKYILVLLFLAFLSGGGDAFGQMFPERKHVRAGNRNYEQQHFDRAEEEYRLGLEKTPSSYEAAFNLGDAIYRQQRWENAEKTFSELSANPSLASAQRAKAFYNLGNAQFQQQKYKEAESSYRMSLIHNPDDREAKYNLAYVQELLKQQQDNDDQKNNDQQDQNRDRQDQNNSGEGENEKDDQSSPDQKDDSNENSEDDDDAGDEQNDGEQNPDNGSEDQDPRSAPPSTEKSGITKEDAANMLNAIQEQEDATREKVNAQKTTTTAKSGKNW